MVNPMCRYRYLQSYLFAGCIVLTVLSNTGSVGKVHAQDGSTTGAAPVRYLLVSSFTCAVPNCLFEDSVLRYDAATGAFLGVHVANVPGAYGLAVHPTRRTLLVVSRESDTVKEYNLNTGAFLRNFIVSGAEGLHAPQNILFKPDGNILLTSTQTDGFLDSFNGILEFDGDDGSFVDYFVDGGYQGVGCSDPKCLFGPNGMAYGPNGNLYVASGANHLVLEYNGMTGAYINYFDSSQLDSPSGLTIRRTGSLRAGNILVTSRYRSPSVPNDTDKVLEFDKTTHELITTKGGVLARGFEQPGPLYWHDDGNLLVGDRTLWNAPPNNSDRVVKLNPSTGAFMASFTPIGGTQLHWSTAMLAVNVVPSNVTDDYDADGDVDLRDMAAFQNCFGSGVAGACAAAFDEDEDGALGGADMAGFTTNFSGPQF
ncbi:MAG: hypothetical protein AABZ47_07015 [Planctomycetota bacterium]